MKLNDGVVRRVNLQCPAGDGTAAERPRVLTHSEVLAELVEERSRIEWQPIRLGFGSIDAVLRGVSAGQVLGIAARTAVGKTFLLNAIAENLAQREEFGTLVASLEMPGTEWVERQVAIHSGVSPEQVEVAIKEGRIGNFAESYLERHRNSLLVDQGISLEQLPEVLAEANSRLDVPVRCVLIDYLGLLDVKGRDAYERASALGKGLKKSAKAERVAIIVAMQLNRDAGDGSEKVTLNMLRDSGVLEESLDFCLGCWRPGKADNLTPAERDVLRNVMSVAVLKNRKGADGLTVDLQFQPDSRRLYEPNDPFEEGASIEMDVQF